jgi:hypothetical protein
MDSTTDTTSTTSGKQKTTSRDDFEEFRKLLEGLFKLYRLVVKYGPQKIQTPEGEILVNFDYLKDRESKVMASFKNLSSTRKRTHKTTKRAPGANTNIGFKKVSYFDSRIVNWLNDPRTTITIDGFEPVVDIMNPDGTITSQKYPVGTPLQKIFTCTSPDQVEFGEENVKLEGICSTGTLAAFMSLYVSRFGLKGVALPGAVDEKGQEKVDYRLWRPDDNIREHFGPILDQIAASNVAKTLSKKQSPLPPNVFPNGAFMQLFTLLKRPEAELSPAEKAFLENEYAITRVNFDQDAISRAVKFNKGSTQTGKKVPVIQG